MKHSRKLHQSAILAALFVTVLASAPAGAASLPIWQGARVAALPAGGRSVYNGYLPYLSCPSIGNCVAGGVYVDASGNDRGLLLNEVNGVWRAPVSVTPPPNAVLKSGVYLSGVSCGSTSWCVAIGTYYDKAGNQLSFAEGRVNGTWVGAKEITLPTNAVASGQFSSPHSVSCSSPGNCAVVGTYYATATPSALTEGFVVDQVGGAWTNARQVALPAGVRGNPYVTLNQVACGSAGNCSAVGSFIDANNVTHSLAVNEVARKWRVAVSTLAPSNASAFAGASLSEVTCVSAGNCAAIGTYNASGSGVQSLVDTEVRGTWSRAVEVQMPASAATNPQAFLFGFEGISCTSAGNCASGGQFIDKSGKYQGFLVNEINGRWQPSSELALPNGAPQVSHNGGVVSLSCVSPGNCSAGAAYVDAAGQYEAMVVNEVGHVWQPATRIALPGHGASVGVGGGIYAIVCHLGGACEAVGSYLSTATNYSGFTVGAS